MRSWFSWTGFVATALLLPFAASAADKPNVVVMLADDLGWADVGYRGSDIETPNLDALAAGGVRLDRLYVPPICSPTRAALMTGRDPLRLGMAYFPIMTWSNKAVSPKERFLPQEFQAAGYQTGMVGKWHLGHTLEIQAPNARGFDDFFGHLHTEVKYWQHTAQGGGHDLQHNGKSVRREGRYLTDVHGEEAARFIEQRDPSKPFFLYVPFLAPHSPMEAPKKLIEKYADRSDPVQRIYAAMVDSLDQAVGTILAALESEGLTKNTIVVFLSDNGGPLMSGAQNTPLRGGKLTTFEGGVRVVGMIRWPAQLEAGQVSEQVMSAMDFYPTLARAAGVTLSNERPLDGRNQWQALSQGKAEPREDDLFFVSESPVRSPYQVAVLSGRWKLIQQISEGQASTTVTNMLFDVVADPSETNDLSAEHPERVAELAERIRVRRALHPVAGQRVEIAPHPGWRSPKDWAAALLPADETILDTGVIYQSQERVIENLQKGYGDRGRVYID
ncbi:MAG: sulfatase-like hydrolase/transferase [Myxococcota bacterium]|jgi:arylsulfatase A-like enzyme|nr:sulfatase-like hydrolase/transferase [Myxococcota bacterium]